MIAFLLLWVLEAKAQVFGSRKRTMVLERRKMSRPLWIKVMVRYGFKCLRCGSRWNLQVDHIKPLAVGGKTVFENLQPLCQRCNRQKWTTTADYRTPRKWWQLLLGI